MGRKTRTDALSAGSDIVQLLAMFEKLSQEQANLTDNLAEFTDWLADHVSSIESHVKRTLLHLQADALAYAMRTVDERLRRKKSELEHVILISNEKGDQNDIKMSPSNGADEKCKHQPSSCSSNRHKNDKKRYETTTKVIDWCKKSVLDVTRQLKAASNQARRCPVETRKARKFAKNLMVVDSGTVDTNFLGSHVIMPDSAKEYGSVNFGCPVSMDNGCFWHRRTGELLELGNSHEHAQLNQTLSKAVYGREEEYIDKGLDLCLIETYGIVVLYSGANKINGQRFAHKSDVLPAQGSLFLQVFEQFTFVQLCEKPVSFSELFCFTDYDVYKAEYKLVRSGSDRFVCFSLKTSAYVELSLDRSYRVSLLRRFVNQHVCAYQIAEDFTLNSNVSHGLILYYSHAVVLATEPRVRCRSQFRFPKSLLLDGCAISDRSLCLVLLQDASRVNHVSFFDLDGCPIASFPVSFSRGDRIFNNQFFETCDSAQLSLFFYYSNLKQLKYLRLRPLLDSKRLSVQFVDDEDALKIVNSTSFKDTEVFTTVKCRSSTLICEEFIPKSTAAVFRVDRTFFMLDAETPLLFCAILDELSIYRSSLVFKTRQVRSESQPDKLLVTAFEKFSTLDCDRAEVVTAVCVLDHNWIVFVVNNAMLVMIEVRSGRRVKTVRFRSDESELDAVAVAASCSTVHLACKFSHTVQRLECDERVFDWNLVKEYDFNKDYRILDMHFDRHSARLAVLSQVNQEFNCKLFVLSSDFEILTELDVGETFCQFRSCFLFKSVCVIVESDADSRSVVNVYEISTRSLVKSIALDDYVLGTISVVPRIAGKGLNKLKLAILFYGQDLKSSSVSYLKGVKSLRLSFVFGSASDCTNFCEVWNAVWL